MNLATCLVGMLGLFCCILGLADGLLLTLLGFAFVLVLCFILQCFIVALDDATTCV